LRASRLFARSSTTLAIAEVRTLLVTGHTGFVGQMVDRVLQAKPGAPDWQLACLPEGFDIRSPELVRRLADSHADAVLHLAALTSVAESFQEPEYFFDVNFHGTWNLLRALRTMGFDGRLLFVSSGDCYGEVTPDELPVQETHPLRPRSPYAVSKVAAEALCQQWAQCEGLDVVLTRSFNHLGPGQDAKFAIAGFARQLALIARGAQPPRIVTGDLDITRDFTDVRDVVTAYLALLDGGQRGEPYNVGSGKETRVGDLLSEMLSIAGITAELVIDPSRVRAGEQRRAAADVRKIAQDTGWRASIPLSLTLADMLNDWNDRISRG
jgi:GDP-4-dehydro-6-deoxy-D-mannose reductase